MMINILFFGLMAGIVTGCVLGLKAFFTGNLKLELKSWRTCAISCIGVAVLFYLHRGTANSDALTASAVFGLLGAGCMAAAFFTKIQLTRLEEEQSWAEALDDKPGTITGTNIWPD